MIFATSSDAGGVATDKSDKAQLAWQVYAADSSLASGSRARVSPLAWRSHRAKRAVPSTLAGEVQALSGALAEAEWLQLLFLDVLQGSVVTEEWRDKVGPIRRGPSLGLHLEHPAPGELERCRCEGGVRHARARHDRVEE